MAVNGETAFHMHDGVVTISASRG